MAALGLQQVQCHLARNPRAFPSSVNPWTSAISRASWVEKKHNRRKPHTSNYGSWYRKYSQGLKSEQFSWMWTNRLQKSRHDRVTAGSQQSLKTQGDCLHLKDTKYHYNKHERAHPSHCRLLLCQHCFALQTIILPQWFDLRRSKTGWTKETMKREEVTVCEKERKEDKKRNKQRTQMKTSAENTTERPPERPRTTPRTTPDSWVGKQAAAASSSKQQQAAASSRQEASKQQAAGKKQASSKQAASKPASQQASKQASSKQQQAAASSSKQQQAAASSSKQQQQQAAGKQQQAAASKQQASSNQRLPP